MSDQKDGLRMADAQPCLACDTFYRRTGERMCPEHPVVAGAPHGDDYCECGCLRRYHVFDHDPHGPCENGAHGWSCECARYRPTGKRMAPVTASAIPSEDPNCPDCDGTRTVDGLGPGGAYAEVKCVACEPPSEDVLRMVHAFDDDERKTLVRDLAARVKATEDELRERRASASDPTEHTTDSAGAATYWRRKWEESHAAAQSLAADVARLTNAPVSSKAPLCGKYLGDNDGTCPQLTCIRARHHDGDCDNVRGDEPCTGSARLEEYVAREGALLKAARELLDWHTGTHGFQPLRDAVDAYRATPCAPAAEPETFAQLGAQVFNEAPADVRVTVSAVCPTCRRPK